MNDREMLELAAKAAGLEPREIWGIPLVKGDGSAPRLTWNPLVDDGDALRLAVKLKMNVGIFGDGDGSTAVIFDQDGRPLFDGRDQHEDAYVATRRAIVRAAAEMGKAMP